MWIAALLSCSGQVDLEQAETLGTPAHGGGREIAGVAAPGPAFQRVLWGDPHAHSGMSHDSCEDAGSECRARVPGLPGEGMLEEARSNQLDWFGLTDHVEFDELIDLETGQTTDIWDRSQEIVSQGPNFDVVGLLGYEWTPACQYGTRPRSGHHRTVLLESPTACGAWRPVACERQQPKIAWEREFYWSDFQQTSLTAAQLEDFLDEGPTECAASDQGRWISFVHHGAYSRPAAVDWTVDASLMDKELLVEIYSEHGSSECADLSALGCLFQVNEPIYNPEGSVQTALSLGLEMGFMGGTDSHDGRPGSVDAPGYVAASETDESGLPVSKLTSHHSPGGVTGVLVAPDSDGGREDLFDAMLLRHTVAATQVFPELQIRAVDNMGNSYLPGDRLPVGSYQLELVLDHPATLELVSPDGSVEPVTDWFVVQSGQVRYLRIRMLIDGQEQRIWASPFFPEP
ncbi:MAG: hypothetical protein VX899_16805 [Myxococcota bacterium]|nr:hypothetical protein [Myxococcota bacterium]